MSHARELSTLKKFSDSRHKLENYVITQEESFDRLLEDIKFGRLKEGTSKSKIVSRYGEPVFCEDNSMYVCLYRYPLRYFSEDKVYLYFDKENKLNRFELGSGGEPDR
jgi:hypothetical protein